MALRVACGLFRLWLAAALTAWLMVAAVTGAAIAGPLEDARAAHGSGDYATAIRLFRPMAENGDAIAQYYLGDLYDKGRGVPQDYAEATKWYRRSAEQGFSLAQHLLGFMYLQGHGVPQDYAEALKWIRRAAEQGHELAQSNLGFAYRDGEGVPQDYVQAHMWLNLAAAQAKLVAGRNIAGEARDSIAAKMSPAQIAEAQRLAREWKPKRER